MQENYLYIVLIVLVVAAVLLFTWMRRDRALPRDTEADTEKLPADQARAAEPYVSAPEAPAGAAPPPFPAAADRDATQVAATPAVDLATPAGPPDVLTTIKGLGPKAATRLNDLGITRFDQLAALSGDRLAAVDAQMGPLQGRIAKDRWVEQARFLAAGDTAGFESTFGKLGG